MPLSVIERAKHFLVGKYITDSRSTPQHNFLEFNFNYIFTLNGILYEMVMQINDADRMMLTRVRHVEDPTFMVGRHYLRIINRATGDALTIDNVNGYETIEQIGIDFLMNQIENTTNGQQDLQIIHQAFLRVFDNEENPISINEIRVATIAIGEDPIATTTIAPIAEPIAADRLHLDALRAAPSPTTMHEPTPAATIAEHVPTTIAETPTLPGADAAPYPMFHVACVALAILAGIIYYNNDHSF